MFVIWVHCIQHVANCVCTWLWPSVPSVYDTTLFTESPCAFAPNIQTRSFHAQVAKLVKFDMCQFGLVSKESKTPMKKTTQFLTNCKEVALAFGGHVCPGLHEHQVIHGSEGGEYRSKWAQRYPNEMVVVVVECLIKAKVNRAHD